MTVIMTMTMMMTVMSLVRSALWSRCWSTPPAAATATSGGSSAPPVASTSSGQQKHFIEFIPITALIHENIAFRPEVCACECRDVRAKRECLEQVKLEIHGNARTLRIILTAIRAGPGQRTRVSAAAPWPPSRAVAPASYLITTPPAPVSRCPASQLPVRVTGVSSGSSVTRRPASAGR